ncbi:MAG: translation initiation factor IF-2 [Candidatus Aenigmarchaeota archaeon]|nr:translation initiation factor IF-2 [Candidatus Aenigmarchaeota archaeon]
MLLTENVDHGKTSLLDAIRGTTVNLAEPGQITQHIGASFVPTSVIKRLCGNLLEKLKIEITIPGLLFIDTPGHEAFITLRKRGGSVADLAVLVVDINEGFQPQTDESLNILKQYKTPFILAATKIDLLFGWQKRSTTCFHDSFSFQRKEVQDELEEKIYSLVAQLYERGFESERFDRITDFKKQVAIVPCSGKTREGISELLVMLSGLAQKFLKQNLIIEDRARGNVLEVKEVKGLGTTIDAIIYDGIIKVGDTLVVGTKEGIVVTKIKALLKPPELRELRMEKKFEYVNEVVAAAGIKIAAPNLENVIAGSPIICVKDENEIEEAKRIIEEETEKIEFNKDIEGVLAKADTLGSLEALVKILNDNQIPVKKAEIGHVTKQDVVEIDAIKDDDKKAILCFNVDLLEEAEILVKEKKIPVFKSNIIYKIVEDYKKWRDDKKEREKLEKLESVVRPAKIRIIPGCVFRKRQPAIFGVEVLAGVLKVNTPLALENKKDVGKVKQIQKEGKNINQIKTGEKAAISLDEPTIGRQINEGDILISVITPHNLKILTEVMEKLQEDEKQLLREWGMI